MLRRPQFSFKINRLTGVVAFRTALSPHPVREALAALGLPELEIVHERIALRRGDIGIGRPI
jgi:hypothetical protein